MAGSTTILDTISSSQASKEVTANALFDAGSPAVIFGRRASTTTALTWGYYGGYLLVDGVLTSIANGTVALTASQTNYVEATRAGVVSKNTTGFTAGSIPLYSVVTGTATVTSYVDYRAWVDPAYLTHQVSFAVTTADVTLTAAQARAHYLTTTGALTGNRSVILPNNGAWLIYCNNTGDYTTTFKTSAGTGVVIPQGTRAMIFADGTNVVLAEPQATVKGRFVKALADANYTLSTAEAQNNILECTGALTALRNLVVPLTAQQWTVFANTSGGFGVQVIGASGTGITVADGKRAIVYADGTNVVRVTADT
jgi:hypothetical protein